MVEHRGLDRLQSRCLQPSSSAAYMNRLGPLTAQGVTGAFRYARALAGSSPAYIATKKKRFYRTFSLFMVEHRGLEPLTS